jgi:hypothetical protein
VYSTSPKFEEIQGLLDYVMRMLNVKRCSADAPAEVKAKCYYVQPSSDPAFFGELAAGDVPTAHMLCPCLWYGAHVLCAWVSECKQGMYST